MIKRKNLEALENYLVEFYINKKPPGRSARDLEKIKNDFSRYKEIDIWDVAPASYLISPVGDIYSVKRKEWRSLQIDDGIGAYPGQYYVLLTTKDGDTKRYSVARLTLAMFKGLPPEDMLDPTVDHINGNPLDNYYENLRWVERETNSSVRHNRGIGEENSRAILTQDDVVGICNRLVKKESTPTEEAERYGVSKETIRDIIKHKTWKYITTWFQFE